MHARTAKLERDRRYDAKRRIAFSAISFRSR
jgi:hypothetical protein